MEDRTTTTMNLHGILGLYLTVMLRSKLGGHRCSQACNRFRLFTQKRERGRLAIIWHKFSTDPGLWFPRKHTTEPLPHRNSPTSQIERSLFQNHPHATPRHPTTTTTTTTTRYELVRGKGRISTSFKKTYVVVASSAGHCIVRVY
jgi:hypothetical protein